MKTNKEQDKSFKKKISPLFPKNERFFRIGLNVFSIVILIASFILISFALDEGNILLTILGFIIFFLTFNNLLSLNPKIYNSFKVGKKMIPIDKKEDMNNFFLLLSQVETPYGRPKFGRIPNTNLILPFFIFENGNFQIFYYLKNNNLYLKCRSTLPPTRTAEDQKRELQALNFLKQVTELSCYLINTKSIPTQEELQIIFNKEEK